jgi:hypothetical protein
MGFYYMKNLDIDKKNGTITAEFADSNVDPISYFKSEIKGKDFHEKYSYLMYDIITGNYHPLGSSKYSALCNTWCEPALENFTGDCTIIGVERAYDKYKKVIDAIIQKKEPEIIKSEIDLHYHLDYGENKDYETLQKSIRNLCNYMYAVRENEKLSYFEKLVEYQKYVKENKIYTPIVTLTGYEHSTKMSLELNVGKDGYVSYKVTVENTETGISKNFESSSMAITWFTDYGENEMAYKIQSYEKRFLVYQKCRDFLNEKIFTKTPEKITLDIKTLNIEDDEIRTFLDILNEDERSKNYHYDRETKTIQFNYNIEKESTELDIVDEMYG